MLQPRLDGLVVAQEIKHRKPGVLVIMVSASPAPEQALAGCVDCFLSKARALAMLLEKIKQLLAPPQHLIYTPKKSAAIDVRGHLADRVDWTGRASR
jgi:CheY-like chemotaxis protein